MVILARVRGRLLSVGFILEDESSGVVHLHAYGATVDNLRLHSRAEVGGPDLHQFEPIGQLVAAARRAQKAT